MSAEQVKQHLVIGGFGGGATGVPAVLAQRAAFRRALVGRAQFATLRSLPPGWLPRPVKEEEGIEKDMESLRERREKVIRQHMEAENRHDAVGVVKTFHRPRYDIVPMGAVNEGAQSVQELMQGLFVGFPDFRAEAVATYHADEAVIVEIKMSGTHRGVWAGIPPTGRPMTLRSIGVFAFEDDRLVGETVYFDFATLARQLGVA